MSNILLLTDGASATVSALKRDLTTLGHCIHQIEPRVDGSYGFEGGMVSNVVVAFSNIPRAATLLIVERLRRSPGGDVCVIALVPPDSEPSLVCGIADDFVIQPASAVEICLRLAVARERRNRPAKRCASPTPHLVLDETAYSVRVDGTPVNLTYTEFELLRALYERRGTVVSREALAREVWGHDQLNGSRAIDVHLWRLRTKLEDGNGHLIDTVRNRGYRLP